MMRTLFIVFIGCTKAVSSGTKAKVDDATLMNQVPLIQTHDAASGHLGDGLVNAWTKTQSCTMYEQLENGARSFDARPKMIAGELKFHHGPVEIDYLFSDALKSITRWCAENPTSLVTLPVSSCAGDGCMRRVRETLDEFGIPSINDCSEFRGMTYGEAKARATLPGAGMLLAITGDSGPSGVACSRGNYDPELACTGLWGGTTTVTDRGYLRLRAAAEDCFERSRISDSSVATTELDLWQLESLVACATAARSNVTTMMQNGGSGRTKAALGAEAEGRRFYGCWTTDEDRDFPTSRLYDHLDEVSRLSGDPQSFFQMQALWQETAESVVIGTLRRSSLVKDENNAQLNRKLAEAVLSERWGKISYLEVNDVCNNGRDLFAALQKAFGPY